MVGPLQRPVGGQPRIAKPRRGVEVAFCTETQRPMPGQCWGPRDCAPLTKPVLVISEFIWRTDLTIANGDISSQETSTNYRYRTLWEEREQNSQKIRDWGSIQLFSDQNKRLSWHPQCPGQPLQPSYQLHGGPRVADDEIWGHVNQGPNSHHPLRSGEPLPTSGPPGGVS